MYRRKYCLLLLSLCENMLEEEEGCMMKSERCGAFMSSWRRGSIGTMPCMKPCWWRFLSTTAKFNYASCLSVPVGDCTGVLSRAFDTIIPNFGAVDSHANLVVHLLLGKLRLMISANFISTSFCTEVKALKEGETMHCELNSWISRHQLSELEESSRLCTRSLSVTSVPCVQNRCDGYLFLQTLLSRLISCKCP